MTWSRPLLGMLLFLILYSTAQSSEVLLLEAQGGRELVSSMAPERYSALMQQTMTAFESASYQAFERLETRAQARSGRQRWRMSAIEVGPSVAASVGVLNWNVGGALGFKLVFEREVAK